MINFIKLKVKMLVVYNKVLVSTALLLVGFGLMF